MTKENYLADFAEFVSALEQSNELESETFWGENLVQYERFSVEWYEKFADQLTWRDELNVGQLQVRFNLLYSTFVATQLTRGTAQSYAQLRDELQFYVENNMQKDIEVLMDAARKSGDTVFNELNTLLETINDDLQQ